MKGRSLGTLLAVVLGLALLLLTSVLAQPANPTPHADTWQPPSLPLEPVDLRLDNPEMLPPGDPIRVPLAAQGWTNIMTEDFEGAWPGAGWSVFDGNGLVNGEYYWAPTTCFDLGASGDHDAVPHAAGASATYTCWQPYPDNLWSWMVYGPFDLSTAMDAELLFEVWLDAKSDHDEFKWLASSDGTFFHGWKHSTGHTGAWVTMNFDLTDVPVLGNLTGQDRVWIALVFKSGSRSYLPFVSRNGPPIPTPPATSTAPVILQLPFRQHGWRGESTAIAREHPVRSGAWVDNIVLRVSAVSNRD